MDSILQPTLNENTNSTTILLTGSASYVTILDPSKKEDANLLQVLESIKSLLDSIQAFSNNVWEFIETESKELFHNACEDLKMHFKQAVKCVVESLKYLFTGNIIESKKYALLSLDHIAFFIDILSYIPALNIIAGVCLIIVYLIQHKWLLAIASLIFLIPFLKWFKKIPVFKSFISNIEKWLTKCSFLNNKKKKQMDIKKEIKKQKKEIQQEKSHLNLVEDNEKVYSYGKFKEKELLQNENIEIKKTGTYGNNDIHNSIENGGTGIPGNNKVDFVHIIYSQQAKYSTGKPLSGEKIKLGKEVKDTDNVIKMEDRKKIDSAINPENESKINTDTNRYINDAKNGNGWYDRRPKGNGGGTGGINPI